MNSKNEASPKPTTLRVAHTAFLVISDNFASIFLISEEVTKSFLFLTRNSSNTFINVSLSIFMLGLIKRQLLSTLPCFFVKYFFISNDVNIFEA